jgi:putative addiction module component (TIGR02574 family)
MGLPLNRIEMEAMELASHERAELATRLIASLDDDAAADPAEVERAWEEEIRLRLAELQAGTAELIPADDVFSELRGRPRR